jgi:replication factor A1
VKINEIESMEAEKIVDIIAIVKEPGDLVNLTSKASRELTKREVNLFDDTQTSISLTMWGEEAKNFAGIDQPVILARGAIIGEYGGGKTLGTTSGTSIKLDPDVQEGHQLRVRQWRWSR